MRTFDIRVSDILVSIAPAAVRTLIAVTTSLGDLQVSMKFCFSTNRKDFFVFSRSFSKKRKNCKLLCCSFRVRWKKISFGSPPVRKIIFLCFRGKIFCFRLVEPRNTIRNWRRDRSSRWGAGRAQINEDRREKRKGTKRNETNRQRTSSSIVESRNFEKDFSFQVNFHVGNRRSQTRTRSWRRHEVRRRDVFLKFNGRSQKLVFGSRTEKEIEANSKRTSF